MKTCLLIALTVITASGMPEALAIYLLVFQRNSSGSNSSRHTRVVRKILVFSRFHQFPLMGQTSESTDANSPGHCWKPH
jgi:hypothetical protein